MHRPWYVACSVRGDGPYFAPFRLGEMHGYMGDGAWRWQCQRRPVGWQCRCRGRSRGRWACGLALVVRELTILPLEGSDGDSGRGFGAEQPCAREPPGEVFSRSHDWRPRMHRLRGAASAGERLARTHSPIHTHVCRMTPCSNPPLGLGLFVFVHTVTGEGDAVSDTSEQP